MAGPLRFANVLTRAGREVAALARQALLLRHDAVGPVLPTDVADHQDVVVLLHGLFATAGVLRPMRRALTRHAGVHTAALTYPPGPGIEEIASRLAALLAALPARVRLHLVGHSLGGVVARYLAQESGDPRVVQTVSLASPFAGVVGARLLGFDCARDLDPASPILRRILLGRASCELPHLSIIAADDAYVRPPRVHALPGGDVLVISGRGHSELLFDPEVARVVEQRVLELRASMQNTPPPDSRGRPAAA